MNDPHPVANFALLPVAQLKNPLKTAGIRKRYIGQVNSRFRRLKALIRRSVIDADAFGLRQNQDVGPRAGEPAGEGEWFGPDDRALAGLTGYLLITSRTVILEEHTPAPILDPFRPGAFEQPYYAEAIERTYDQGLRRVVAISEDTSLTAARLQRFPTHREALGILKNRQLEKLKDITEDMAARLRTIVSRGLQEGIGKTEMAGRIVKGIDKFGFHRAQTLAATEITNAFAEATLNGFETVGVREVTAAVEFTLNVHGFAEPCPLCIELAGKRYSIAGARGVLPIHPRCQCGWLPVRARALAA